MSRQTHYLPEYWFVVPYINIALAFDTSCFGLAEEAVAGVKEFFCFVRDATGSH